MRLLDKLTRFFTGRKASQRCEILEREAFNTHERLQMRTAERRARNETRTDMPTQKIVGAGAT